MPTGTKDHELSDAENATIDRCCDAFEVLGLYSSILNAWRMLTRYGTSDNLIKQIDEFKRLGAALVEAVKDAYPLELPKSTGEVGKEGTYHRLRPIVPFGKLDLDQCIDRLTPGLERCLENLKNAEKALADNNVCFNPDTGRIKCNWQREGGGAPKNAFNHIVGLVCQEFVNEDYKKKPLLATKDFRVRLGDALGVFLDEPGLSDSSRSGPIARAISNYLHR